MARGPTWLAGAGDQRGVVSAVARPGRGALHGGVDVDPRCGCEPRPDGRLGPDRRGRPGDRVNTLIRWSHHRHARARARHLAPVPQGGAVNRRAILHTGQTLNAD